MFNYKLTIQYDGTNYAGWQIQKNAISVQQKISEAIEIITKEKINLIGAGRTDAGVHALGQVANFKVDVELDLYKFQYSLNSILPSDISITSSEKVNENFHARFDAKSRAYIYLISKIKSPFYDKYSYRLPYIAKMNITYLNKISKVLIGEHDFTSFSRKNTETENKVCDVKNIWWKETKNFILFYIQADRFLHGMVRTIIGTLLKTIEKKRDENYILEILNKKDRETAGEAVPTKGLFLYKVRY
ncbi:tRNA pseudouridine(38-40) synthase TruA [Melioribacteraceae bacterium 4301-Me]|uniref:tRNA pseudouridine(38-40) synthase TruA n=1 Tax=Pyranulibacter aquaticus TaxID=3163344 RepID=UPI003594AAD3